MNKRIGIDARWITKEISGIGRYTEHLIHALAEIDSVNLYYLFFSDESVRKKCLDDMSLSKYSNVTPVLVPYSPFSLRGMWVMRREIKRLKLECFHSTNFMLPLFGPNIKYIATVHDLIPLIHPEYTPKAKKTRYYFIYSKLMKWIGKKCDLIITDSDHSKNDVVRALNVPAEKVKRVYIGIDSKYQTLQKEPFPKALEEQWPFKPPYFLYVGRHDPYKNLVGLVKAYDRYLRKESQPIPLVITGKQDPRYPEAFQYCQKENLLHQIHFTGYVEDAVLPILYQHAVALVLVSRYEGFGLPVLEAMACGTPVLCSNAASLPEVAGEAALIVDPEDLDKIADGLAQLTTSESLRQQLSQKGREQSKKFSWENCARETFQFYQSL